MRITLRRAIAASFAAGTALSIAALPAVSGASTPKPDPYLVADTQMNFSASAQGGGSTFAAPLENAGQAYYLPRNGNASLGGYQAVGSGAGESGLITGTYNWGGTDVPLMQSDINADQPAGKNYTLADFLQVPIGLGGEAIAYNLPGFTSKIHLDLTGKVLAEIYAGKITTWNNAQIKAINPKYKTKLPNHAIETVCRSDKSGTTYIYTNYLSVVAPTIWTAAPSKSPLTCSLPGSGNNGVAQNIQNNKYTLGYVEYSYLLLNPKLLSGVAAIQNKSHKWVLPSPAGVAADAAKKPNVSSTSFAIVNETGATSYPIAGYTWAVIFKNQANLDTGTLVVKYLDWLSHSFPGVLHKIAGQNLAGQQGYVPLPANIQHLARVTLLAARGPSNKVLLTTNGS
jgi:phosphate transport system substrate-binding protein